MSHTTKQRTPTGKGRRKKRRETFPYEVTVTYSTRLAGDGNGPADKPLGREQFHVDARCSVDALRKALAQAEGPTWVVSAANVHFGFRPRREGRRGA